MKLRRPSIRSTLYMALLALGMLFVGQLIFRGAGAPMEPARMAAPGNRPVYLAAPGRYVVLTEQVAAPRPMSLTELHAPEIAMELTDPSGARVALNEPQVHGWFFKFFTRQRGHTLGSFEARVAGDYRVKADLVEMAGRKPDCVVIVAFSPMASTGRFLWLVLGFGGQVFFSLRFLVQWLASERTGRSTIPRSFWYFSMIGGLMVLAYAIQTRDPVFILAYAFNAFIYLRNLILLRREDEAQLDAPPSSGGRAPSHTG